jgi:hypothetical protein
MVAGWTTVCIFCGCSPRGNGSRERRGSVCAIHGEQWAACCMVSKHLMPHLQSYSSHIAMTGRARLVSFGGESQMFHTATWRNTTSLLMLGCVPSSRCTACHAPAAESLTSWHTACRWIAIRLDNRVQCCHDVVRALVPPCFLFAAGIHYWRIHAQSSRENGPWLAGTRILAGMLVNARSGAIGSEL